jgi:hypothetical protein
MALPPSKDRKKHHMSTNLSSCATYPNPWPQCMLVHMLRIASRAYYPGSMDLLDFGIVCFGYCILSYTPHLFFSGA